ncbi:MAG: hypothetical protein SW019_25120 [Actinomycetota bacterium]|nr:hypothetical protein [Actinomycetota bacterium]
MDNWGDIVVVENGECRAYDWHWAGQRILDILIGGPDLARRHIATFRQAGEREPQPVEPGHSGALLDFDRGRLLFFGDELMGDVQQRRALLCVLGDLWPGFQVGWAHGGTHQLADYVGLTCPVRPWDSRPPIVAQPDRDAPCHLVSVTDAGGATHVWTLSPSYRLAKYGPAVLGALPGRGRTTVTLKAAPASGMHIDPARRFLGVWQDIDTSGVLGRLTEIWPGWSVEFWADRFEEHLARCGRALRVPAVDLRAGMGDVRESLRHRIYRRGDDGPMSEALALAETLGRIAPGLAVPADAVIAGLVRPTREEWDRFEAACRTLDVTRAA